MDQTLPLNETAPWSPAGSGQQCVSAHTTQPITNSLHGEPRRMAGLDHIRATAILLVVAAHAIPRAVPFADVPGWIGVEVFFALSGTLIGPIVYRTVFAPSDAPPIARIARFWHRRWMRTIPAYFVALAFSALLARVLGNARLPAIAPYAAFVQNFAWPMPRFFDASWSLAIEEWFYLLCPMILFAAASVLPRRIALTTFPLVLGIFGVVCRARYAVAYGDWDIGVRKLVITRIDAIAYGTAVSWLELELGEFSDRLRRLMAAAGAATVAASTALLLAAPPNSEHGLGVAFAFAGMPLGFAMWMPWIARLPALAGIGGRVLRWISELSYSLYHLPLILAANELGKQWLGAGGTARALSRMAALALSALAAWALHTVVEKPLMRLRRPEL